MPLNNSCWDYVLHPNEHSIYLFYLDLLGFSSVVNNAKQASRNLSIDIGESLKVNSNAIKKSQNGLFVSDSTFFIVHRDDRMASDLQNLAIFIQGILNDGFIFYGSLVFGDVLYDANGGQLIGKPLVDAVTLWNGNQRHYPLIKVGSLNNERNLLTDYFYTIKRHYFFNYVSLLLYYTSNIDSTISALRQPFVQNNKVIKNPLCFASKSRLYRKYKMFYQLVKMTLSDDLKSKFSEVFQFFNIQ